MTKKIDNSKLDVRETKKVGGSIFIPMTGFLEEGKKYVVDKIVEKRKDGRLVTHFEIEDIDSARKTCLEWHGTTCSDCFAYNECELK